MTDKPKLPVRPVMLIIRDGWGHNPSHDWDKANATVLANTPVDRRLRAEYPTVQIHTSGEDVGLPAGVMGNSEVGHQNIGAGRIVDQEIMRVTRMIRDGSFFTTPATAGAIDQIKKTGGTLHVMGLVSDGRVHSDLEHLLACVDLFEKSGLPADRLAIHAILDGRDTSPVGGIDYLATVQKKLDASGVGRIVDVIGRFYAMDRDFRWERVRKAYDLYTKGSEKTAPTAAEAVQAYYDHPTDASRGGDEFVEPVSISADGTVPRTALVKDGDAVLFFNVRGDRPREIIKAFVLDDAAWAGIENKGFDRGKRIENLWFATMADYEKGLPVHVVSRRPEKMEGILGAVLAEKGLTQFRCAESEKAPHVSFFFNDYRETPGGRKPGEVIPGPFPGEDQLEVPSPRDVATYDLKPEMSAAGVTEAVLSAVAADKYDVYIVNYANGDMVGHTGSIPAAVKAVETVDRAVGQLAEAVLAKGGALVITADHGNCEQMVDPETGRPHTAHTTYDVDLIVVDDRARGKTLRADGRLADIAPTILDLLGIETPAAMTGRSLLKS